MPTNLTDSDAFTDPIQGPADADPADATYVLTGHQGNANRTRYLYNRLIQRPTSAVGDNVILRTNGDEQHLQGSGLTLDDSDNLTGLGNVTFSGEPTYASAKSRTLAVPGTALFCGNAAINVALAANPLMLTASSVFAELSLPPIMPSGAVVSAIRCLVTPGAARSGTSRMSLSLVENTTYSMGSTPSVGSSSVVSTVSDDTSSSLQVLTLSGLSYAVDNSGSMARLRVKAGDTASTSNDLVYGIEIDWTDPGPRNY